MKALVGAVNQEKTLCDCEIFAKVRLKLFLADVVVLAVEVGVGVQLPRHLVHGDEGGRGEVEDTAWGECFEEDFKRTSTFREQVPSLICSPLPRWMPHNRKIKAEHLKISMTC